MIYLRAALYAEGPSDYGFLVRRTTRIVHSIAAGLFPGNSAVAGPSPGVASRRPSIFAMRPEPAPVCRKVRFARPLS